MVSDAIGHRNASLMFRGYGIGGHSVRMLFTAAALQERDCVRHPSSLYDGGATVPGMVALPCAGSDGATAEAAGGEARIQKLQLSRDMPAEQARCGDWSASVMTRNTSASSRP